MIILKPYFDEQITIIPNRNTGDAVLVYEFTNEITKTVYTKYPNFIYYNRDLLIADIVTSNFLQENTFYNLKVYFRDDTDTILYKDKVFATSQDINTYSINEGQYVTPTIDNNSYITL